MQTKLKSFYAERLAEAATFLVRIAESSVDFIVEVAILCPVTFPKQVFDFGSKPLVN